MFLDSDLELKQAKEAARETGTKWRLRRWVYQLSQVVDSSDERTEEGMSVVRGYWRIWDDEGRWWR